VTKFNYIQNSFSYGEVDPKALGRSDTKNYQQGLKLLDNFLPLGAGGISRRQGLRRKIAALNPDSLPISIVQHTITEGIVFFILVTNKYDLDSNIDTRFYILDSNYSLVVSDFLFKKNNKTPYIVGDSCQYGVNIVLVEKYGSFSPILLRFDYSSGTYTEKGFPYYELDSVVTNWYEGVPYNLQYNATSVYLVCNTSTSGPLLSFTDSLGRAFPNIYLNESNKIWRFQTLAQEAVVRFNLIDNPQLSTRQYSTLTPAAVSTANNTIQLGAGYAFSTGCLVKFTDGGVPLGLQENKLYYVNSHATDLLSFHNSPAEAGLDANRVDITSTGFGTFTMELVAAPNAYVVRLAAGNSAANNTTVWTVSLFYDTSWPKVCNVFAERLVFANTSSYPDTIFVSNVRKIIKFINQRLNQDPSVASDDDAFVKTISSKEFEGIQWLVSANNLIIGTSASEYSAITETFNYKDTFFFKNSSIGSSDVPACQIEGKVIHVDRTGKGFRYLEKANNTDSYSSKDISIINKSLVDYKTGYSNDVVITKIISNKTSGIVWAILNDGGLISVVISESGAVLAGNRNTFNEDIYIIDGCSYTGEDGIERISLIYKTISDGKFYIGEIPISVFEGNTSKIDDYSDDRSPIFLDHSAIARNRVTALIRNDWLCEVFSSNNSIDTSVDAFTHTFQFVLNDSISRPILNRKDSSEVFNLSTDATKKLVIKVYKNSEAKLKHFVGSSTIAEDIVYIVSFSFDDGNIKLYVNGIEETLTTVTNNTFTTIDSVADHPIRLFCYIDATIGAIGRYTFHSRVLSGSEVLAIFTSISSNLPLTSNEYFIEESIKPYEEVYTADLIIAKDCIVQNSYGFNTVVKAVYKPSGIIKDPALQIDYIPYLNTVSFATTLVGSFTVTGIDAVTENTVTYGMEGNRVRQVVDYTKSTETIVLGYNYNSRLETLTPEAGGQFGTAIGMVVRIHEAIFSFYKTIMNGIKIGSDGKLSDRLDGNTVSNMKYKVELPQSPEIDNSILLSVDKPTPCSILAVTMKGVTYDE
jgi:hypothetical protein